MDRDGLEKERTMISIVCSKCGFKRTTDYPGKVIDIFNQDFYYRKLEHTAEGTFILCNKCVALFDEVQANAQRSLDDTLLNWVRQDGIR